LASPRSPEGDPRCAGAGAPSRAARSARWRVIAGVILLAGIAASIVAAFVWRAQVNLEANRSFDLEASEVGSTVTTALLRMNDLAVSARALLVSQPALGNRELANWWINMGARSRYSGVVGFGYIAFVPAARLAAVTAQVRRDPIPGVAAASATPSASSAPRKPYYCLARLGVASPLTNTLLSPGIDFCSIPGFDALQAARDSGRLNALTLGGRIVVLFSPVYKGGIDPPTVSLRRDRIAGVVAELVDVQSILGQALAGHRDLQIGVAQRDFVPLPAASSGIAGRFAMRVGALSPLASVGSVHGEVFRRTVVVDADGRWVVSISRSRANGFLTPDLQALIMLVGGVLVSGLAFLLVQTLSTSRARALRTVEERTRQLRHQALHDSLTGLPNRQLLTERAELLLDRGRREGAQVAALFMDIDDFKGVNDNLGHLAGDQLLREVARRIVKTLRETDSVGRMGGDEFVILAGGRPTDAGPERLAERLLESMREPFAIAGTRGALLSVCASIGIAVGDRRDSEEMLGDADIALYRAKTAGKNQYVVFAPEMRGRVDDRLVFAKGASAEVKRQAAPGQTA
jgi:diguanylate cyclase (GGDEF)-like protein